MQFGPFVGYAVFSIHYFFYFIKSFINARTEAAVLRSAGLGVACRASDTLRRLPNHPLTAHRQHVFRAAGRQPRRIHTVIRGFGPHSHPCTLPNLRIDWEELHMLTNGAV